MKRERKLWPVNTAGIETRAAWTCVFVILPIRQSPCLQAVFCIASARSAATDDVVAKLHPVLLGLSLQR